MNGEDEIRKSAGEILGFYDDESNVQQGTGQIKTFNQLGFTGVYDRPDGWYLPDNGGTAIILETKDEGKNIEKYRWELFKNMKVVSEKYDKVVGILYNVEDIMVFKSPCDGSAEFEQVTDTAKTLQNKSYYLSLFGENRINKGEIYALTKKINDCLHTEFGIKNLYHRMIITACALVAKRYGAKLSRGMSYSVMKTSILDTLQKSLENDRKQNIKIEILVDVYKGIEMNMSNDSNQGAVDNFIMWVSEISDRVNSNYWNGEDVMGIFFNEFNRYKKKTESGQVFTPDHITSFIYRLLDVNMHDRILDATCGSGAFLVKAMCNMIREAGGVTAKEAQSIKSCQLFGIEYDKEIFALACANMLIHKDGKTNLEQLDSRTQEAADWIRQKGITKVLMNPPYERKYGCMRIVNNVLDSVPAGTKCAFILPDKKLEKDGADKRYGNKILKRHTLTTIVKLPENLFFGIGVTTSIFVFEAGRPQGAKNIIGYYIEDDGLVTVKNQGRQDTKNRWEGIEDYWIKAIHDGCDEKYGTRQIIDPAEHLSYQMPARPFEVFEEDFMKTIMDYEMFKRGLDVKNFTEQLVQKVLYTSDVIDNASEIHIVLKKREE